MIGQMGIWRSHSIFLNGSAGGAILPPERLLLGKVKQNSGEALLPKRERFS
jgi:hypothetical protein